MEAEAGGRRMKAGKFIYLRVSKILIAIYRTLPLSLLLISAAGYLC